MSEPSPVHATERLMMRLGAGFAEISVDIYEPKEPDATIFCLHDYWGNGRDFSQLGPFLVAHQYRVICPDMPGRGDSAYLADPRQYRPETFLIALMAVLQAFKDRHIGIIGKGWGALLALLLNARMSFALDRLVVTDAPLSWSVDEDDLPPADQLEFASVEAARHNVLASRELANLPEPFAATLAEGRVRATENGRSALRFDPNLIAQLERYRGGTLDTARLLAGVGSPLLYLASNALVDEDRKAVQASLTNPGSTIADALAPNGRIHFNSAHQQLLLLGFLKNRLPSFA